jgi:hypothetical protein
VVSEMESSPGIGRYFKKVDTLALARRSSGIISAREYMCCEIESGQGRVQGQGFYFFF